MVLSSILTLSGLSRLDSGLSNFFRSVEKHAGDIFIADDPTTRASMYDLTMKCISPEFPKDLATLIFGRRLDLKPLPESLPTTEHRPDFLAKVTTPAREFVIHIEFQTRYDPKMPIRMVSYHGRILYQYRLPVYPVVVYLSSEDSKKDIESTYTSSICDKQVIAFDYDVVKVWELESEMIFEKKLYGMYPLTPLMRGADLAECFREAEGAVTHKHLNADSYACIRIFAGMKFPDEVVKAMIKDDWLKQSVFYKETFEEGASTGMDRGRNEGIILGEEKGILSVLVARFGSVPDRISRRVHTIRERNAGLLDDLIALAATARDMSEFEKKLERMA
jgi:predicted transposase YdaD